MSPGKGCDWKFDLDTGKLNEPIQFWLMIVSIEVNHFLPFYRVDCVLFVLVTYNVGVVSR